MRFAIVALVLAAAAPAVADVGVITVVEGVADPAMARHNIETSLQKTVPGRVVPLTATGPCEKTPDAKCIESLVAAMKRDIDEVAVVTIKHTPPATTLMTLKVLQSSDWSKTALEVSSEFADADATNASIALVREAFDPGHYSGKLVVDGAPLDATIFVDGLLLDEPVAMVSVGRHVLLVRAKDGRTFSQDVDMGFGKVVHVAVPAFGATTAQRATWPRWVAGSVLAVGLVTAAAGVGVDWFSVHDNAQFNKDGTYSKSIDNIDEWNRHARDTVGFLPAGNEDPACPRDGYGNCLDNSAWSEKRYGPSRGAGVSEPAHFAMIAVSRENELGWHATEYAAVSSIIGGSIMAVAGGVAFAATFFSE